MARREHRAERANQTFSEATDRRRAFVRAGGDAVRLWLGLRCVPLSRRGKPPALRTNHGFQLRCGAAEKWQDGISLQPSGGADLRPRAVSTRGIRALLVPAAAYRAAHGHLTRTLRVPEG